MGYSAEDWQLLFLSTSPARGTTGSLEALANYMLKFLSTSPARGTTGRTLWLNCASSYFYPRPPRGGRRLGEGFDLLVIDISIHVPREGDDRLPLVFRKARTDFYPRPPRGGRRYWAVKPTRQSHFYPRPPRGGRRVHAKSADSPSTISIHVPREGDDSPRQKRPARRRRFLSTSPARGTTALFWNLIFSERNFYPRPPRGGRRRIRRFLFPVFHISIHVPREGDDLRRYWRRWPARTFLSTSPARGTTRHRHTGHGRVLISIHVPREGDDYCGKLHHFISRIFLSTSPARGTTHYTPDFFITYQFLSTSPARGTTSTSLLFVTDSVISIHVPREGDDPVL